MSEERKQTPKEKKRVLIFMNLVEVWAKIVIDSKLSKADLSSARA